jgi:CBS domain-containing protein
MFIKNNRNISVEKAMLSIEDIPILNEATILKEAIDEMCKYKLGIVCIIGKDFKLKGIITDGDLRRKLLYSQKPLSALMVEDSINMSIKRPKTISPKIKLLNAIKIMEKARIWDLPVINKNRKLLGMLHLHNTIKYLK